MSTPPIIIENEDGTLTINGFLLDGELCKETFCPVCNQRAILHLAYDACFCPVCNEWLEGVCGDKGCMECAGRPARPLLTTLTHYETEGLDLNNLTDTDKKMLIGIAGEFRVAAELLKKGYHANVTFGNTKATDIVVMNETNRFLRIEVKTSKNGRNFVTGYYPKYTDPTRRHPDVWVFYLPEKDGSSDGDRFFLLTHEEVGNLQLDVNQGVMTEKGKGCDNIPLDRLANAKYENRWELVGKLICV